MRPNSVLIDMQSCFNQMLKIALIYVLSSSYTGKECINRYTTNGCKSYTPTLMLPTRNESPELSLEAHRKG